MAAACCPEMVRTAAGLEFLRSPLLGAHGVPHAFSTRRGGVSAGVYESLNFGSPMEARERDPAANVRENYRRLLDAAGLGGRRVVEAFQVHGAVVCGPEGLPAPGGPGPRADAIVVEGRGLAAAVRTADCWPILLASADGGVVAAVHAGWRGTVAGVLPRAIARLRERTRGELLAAIGPGIGRESFEVGPEVVGEFRREFGAEAPVLEHPDPGARTSGRALVDLRAALVWQLRVAGVERFDVDGHCTYRRADLFFSHRREGGLTGRMASVIGPAAEGRA
jgi:YfiH family protein